MTGLGGITLEGLKPLLANAADKPAYWVVGDRYTFLLEGKETGGAFDLFEFVVPPGRGSPPHVHTREHELFMVVDGEVEFTADGTKIPAKAGDTVFGPKDVPHNFTCVGDAPARMLVVVFPAGLAEFFRAVGVPAADDRLIPPAPTKEDIEKIKAVAPEFGVRLLIPEGH